MLCCVVGVHTLAFICRGVISNTFINKLQRRRGLICQPHAIGGRKTRVKLNYFTVCTYIVRAHIHIHDSIRLYYPPAFYKLDCLRVLRLFIINLYSHLKSGLFAGWHSSVRDWRLFLKRFINDFSNDSCEILRTTAIWSSEMKENYSIPRFCISDLIVNCCAL